MSRSTASGSSTAWYTTPKRWRIMVGQSRPERRQSGHSAPKNPQYGPDGRKSADQRGNINPPTAAKPTLRLPVNTKPESVSSSVVRA
jgi:hypothetical protein